MKNLFVKFLYAIFCLGILFLSVRGNVGNPSENDINTDYWVKDGPFELSPERGRFALTYSLVEDNSVFFNEKIAEFTAPDLGWEDGKYVSLFAPGVSYLVVPGYLLGENFGLSQVGTSLVIVFFAFANVILIYKIAHILGAKRLYAALSSLVFIFATPALAYASSLYQHHISTFLILASLYSLVRYRGYLGVMLTFLMYGISISVDYPNAIIMLPLVACALSKMFQIASGKTGMTLKFDVKKMLVATIVILPLLFLFRFNEMSYSSSTRLAGTVRDVADVVDGKPVFEEDLGEEEAILTHREKTALGFFETRNMINGMYVHTISSDRGVFFFAPIVLFALLGVGALRQKNSKALSILFAIIGVNILLYSMWGDPWGGWSFGSRYLIPSYASLSIVLAFAIKSISKEKYLIILFIAVLVYSVSVNTLGAITSSSNPPKIEAQELGERSGKVEKYTFERNFDLMIDGKIKSFVYNSYVKETIPGWKYYYAVTASVVSVLVLLTLYSTLFHGKRRVHKKVA